MEKSEAIRNANGRERTSGYCCEDIDDSVKATMEKASIRSKDPCSKGYCRKISEHYASQLPFSCEHTSHEIEYQSLPALQPDMRTIERLAPVLATDGG